jgi:hypothetical protein
VSEAHGTACHPEAVFAEGSLFCAWAGKTACILKDQADPILNPPKPRMHAAFF